MVRPSDGRVLGKVETAIRRARSQDKGINRIARDLGVGSATVRRVLIEKPVA